MDNISIWVPLIIPFLSLDDRHKLSQCSREFRSIICSDHYELETFLHIAKVYNCYAEVFDVDRFRENPYCHSQFNTGLLKIKTWLGALLRTERMYARCERPADLRIPVGMETWLLKEDSRLDELVKHLQFLSSGFVKGCKDVFHDEYLRTLSRFTYPLGQTFNIHNFMSLSEKHLFLTLASAIHAQYRRWPTPMRGVPDPLLESAVRLVYVSHPGELPVFDECSVPYASRTVRHAAQPFLSKAVLRDQNLIRSVVHNSKPPPPFAFLRWLTDSQSDSDIYDLSSSMGDPMNYLIKYSGVLSDDPALWTLQGDDRVEANVEKRIDNLPSHQIVSAQDKYWQRGLNSLKKYLNQVLTPFTLEEAEHIRKAYAAHNMTLHTCGDVRDSRGAYLEVTLDNSTCGPNFRTCIDIHSAEVCVLYVGSTEAVLYFYHERLAARIERGVERDRLATSR